jgi:phosphatidylserine decarboxylase
MEIKIFASSIGLALVSLALLSWKWRTQLSIVIPAALLIGGLTGGIVSLIDFKLVHLNMIALVFVELFFILLIAFLSIIMRFYRDPERTPVEVENVILSPADGKIIYIRAIERNSGLVSTKGKRQFKLHEIIGSDMSFTTSYLLGIDMNMLNVHVNRAPIGGKIVLTKRTNGKFVSLSRPESEIINERVTTIIDNGQFKVAVVQIASRLVRRVVSFVKEGENVAIGQKIGMIKLGSQVDVTIPTLENLEICVKTGDQVKAGLSVIARYA